MGIPLRPPDQTDTHGKDDAPVGAGQVAVVALTQIGGAGRHRL
ncbi:hypothetical protein [Jannaschia sp. AI_61]|nr:hypothetical protein [Jannaschia sp. AI_61]